MNDFKIVPNVGIWQLNPMNHALRNDYIENLLDLSVNSLPLLYNEFEEVIVSEGFVSKKNLKDDDLLKNKRCSGNCICIVRPSIPDSELIDKLKNVLCAKSGALSFVLDKEKLFIVKGLNNFSSINRVEDNKIILLYKK